MVCLCFDRNDSLEGSKVDCGREREGESTRATPFSG